MFPQRHTLDGKTVRGSVGRQLPGGLLLVLEEGRPMCSTQSKIREKAICVTAVRVYCNRNSLIVGQLAV